MMMTLIEEIEVITGGVNDVEDHHLLKVTTGVDEVIETVTGTVLLDDEVQVIVMVTIVQE